MLTNGPEEISILLPIRPREALEQAEMQTWEEKARIQKTKLMPGLILILPGIRYVMPDDIPFAPLFCHLTPLDKNQ